MGGGDLLNLLIERDVFEEDFTRFYVAEVRTFLFDTISEWLKLLGLLRWFWLSSNATSMGLYTGTSSQT